MSELLTVPVVILRMRRQNVLHRQKAENEK